MENMAPAKGTAVRSNVVRWAGLQFRVTPGFQPNWAEALMIENEKFVIGHIVRQLETAWNAGSSSEFAAPFAADADFINILGAHYNGRGVIDAGHRLIFDTVYADSRNNFTVERLRFIRPDVAIVFVRAELRLRDGRTIHARPTLVLAKDNERWHIVALQNTAISETSLEQAVERVALRREASPQPRNGG